MPVSTRDTRNNAVQELTTCKERSLSILGHSFYTRTRTAAYIAIPAHLQITIYNYMSICNVTDERY